MAIEGNLEDMSLPNIMQIICLERRRVGLTLKRSSEQGMIYFDKGEIVHAAVGALQGEEAVYHLLSWADGSFRTNNEINIPHQSVAMRWDQLLMEGMRRIDEMARDESHAMKQMPPRPELRKVDIERDSNLENEMLLLLSELEHLCMQLSNSQKRPAAALQIMAVMVNQVAALSETSLDKMASQNSLASLLRAAAPRYPVAAALTSPDNRLNVKAVVSLYSDAAGANRTHALADAGALLTGIIESYFALLTACFRSASVMTEINEACQFFLNDLHRATSGVQS